MPMTAAMLALTGLLTAAAPPAEISHTAEIEAWRKAREERLQSDTGWLTVAGLFWLEPGKATFGSDPASDIVLPAGTPARAGVFVRDGERITVEPAEGVSLTLSDKPVAAGTLLPIHGDPLRVGRLSLYALRRGDRYGIRMRDPESALRRDFKGIPYYPIDETRKVTARFVPDAKPQTVRIVNVLGIATDEPSPGVVEFTLGGRTLRLRPIIEDGDAREWFYIFKDETAPEETYGGGRFVYTKPAEDGRVVLDFNKAYNPPCAFNPYTTCPLPPKENHLPVAVRAGERKPRK
jgi:uncharacterized protein